MNFLLKQPLARDNSTIMPQYYPGMEEIYPPVHLEQRLLSVTKPLRIIIIRHAERADAVLGSDWSKKSFDRAGRYIRFTEHLPDAYVIPLFDIK